MKTIILAGGYGTRMGDIAEMIPKPMIQVGGKPILWHVMKLYASQGFIDFMLALLHKSNFIKVLFFNYKIHADFRINKLLARGFGLLTDNLFDEFSVRSWERVKGL